MSKEKAVSGSLIMGEDWIVAYCPDRDCYLRVDEYYDAATVEYSTSKDPYDAEGVSYTKYFGGSEATKCELNDYLKKLRGLTHHKCIPVVLNYQVTRREL